MDKQVFQPPLEYCPLCAAQRKISKIVPFFINFDEAVFLCSEDRCQYPFGHDDFVFMPLGHLSCQEQLDICDIKYEKNESDQLTDDMLSTLSDMSGNDTIWNESLLSSLDLTENLQFDESFFITQFADSLEVDSNNESNKIEESNDIKKSCDNLVTSIIEDDLCSMPSEKAPDKHDIVNTTGKSERLPEFSTISKNSLKKISHEKTHLNLIKDTKLDYSTNKVSKNIELPSTYSIKDENDSSLTDHCDKGISNNVSKIIAPKNSSISKNVTVVGSHNRVGSDLRKSISYIELLLKPPLIRSKATTHISNPKLLQRMKQLPNFNKRKVSPKKGVTSCLLESNTELQPDIKISYSTPIDIKWETMPLSIDLSDNSKINLLPLSNVSIGKVMDSDNCKNDTGVGTICSNVSELDI